MTDITLEQRAFLESGAYYYEIDHGPDGKCQYIRREDLGKIIQAALRLSAGADWVLVPRVPTEAMCEAAGDGPIFIEGRMDGNTFIQSTHYDQRYLLDTWERMLAAAPRHEPGEGL